MKYKIEYDTPPPNFNEGIRMNSILKTFGERVINENNRNDKLASVNFLKPLLDETFPDRETFFFSPLSYFKNIAGVVKPVFWVITTKPLPQYSSEYPREISWGFVNPIKNAEGENQRIDIYWMGSLRFGNKVWHEDPYVDANAVILGTIMDETYDSSEYLDNLWGAADFWTKSNFGFPKVRQSTQYKYESKMLVIPLAPVSEEERKRLGLLNWWW